MNTIDETTLLRFGSGELDAQQEATFLARCELTSGAWREAALAVVEHRRMVEALGELAGAQPPEATVRTPPPRGRWRALWSQPLRWLPG